MFSSIYFTITGARNIIWYTKDLVIRGLLYRGSTVQLYPRSPLHCSLPRKRLTREWGRSP